MPSKPRHRKLEEGTALLDAPNGAAGEAGGTGLYAEDKPNASTNMSFLVAACFCVNYVMGSGFLGLPAVFHEAGLVLSPMLLVLFMWLSDATKDMVLEAMARQEALSRLHERRRAKAEAKVQLRSLRRRGAVVPRTLQLQALGPVRWRKRDFVVAHNRTFQVNELMHELWGRGAEVAYMVGISLYLVGSMWGYSSVFSASFAANVPLDFISNAVGGVCDVETSWADCASHYHFYLAIFACIAVPLACMEFREQAVVQVTMTVARIAVLVLLVTTVLGGMGCDGVSFLGAPKDASQRAAQARLADGVGLVGLLPVCLFAFIFHHSIPGVAEPVRDKTRLPAVFSLGFIITGTGYLILATLAAFFFGNSVKRQASLAWEGYVGCVPPGLSDEEAMAARSVLAAAVASFILIFPALDVTSAYPLNAVTLANSLATAILPPAELVEMHSAIAAAAAASEEAKRSGRTCSARLLGALAACCFRGGATASSEAASAAARDEDDGAAAAIAAADSSRGLDETDVLVPALAAAAASVAVPGGGRLDDASQGAAMAMPAPSDGAPAPAVYAPMVCGGVLRRGTGIKLLFRVLASGVPLVGGAFVADLGTILSWTGLVGVGIGLTVPALLQIRARSRCLEECRKLMEEREAEERADQPMPEAATPLIDPEVTGRFPGTPLQGIEMLEEAEEAGSDPAEAAAAREIGVLVAKRSGSGDTDESGGADAAVEEDDVVELLRAELKEATSGGLGVEMSLSDAALLRALATPFDHSVLSGRLGAWGVVALSAVMAVIVVVGLTALPAN